MTDPESGEQASSVSCALCGRTADPVPLTWLIEFDARSGTRHFCDPCSRDNLRAVEAKLPRDWW